MLEITVFFQFGLSMMVTYWVEHYPYIGDLGGFNRQCNVDKTLLKNINNFISGEDFIK